MDERDCKTIQRLKLSNSRPDLLDKVILHDSDEHQNHWHAILSHIFNTYRGIIWAVHVGDIMPIPNL